MENDALLSVIIQELIFTSVPLVCYVLKSGVTTVIIIFNVMWLFYDITCLWDILSLPIKFKSSGSNWK